MVTPIRINLTMHTRPAANNIPVVLMAPLCVPRQSSGSVGFWRSTAILSSRADANDRKQKRHRQQNQNIGLHRFASPCSKFAGLTREGLCWEPRVAGTQK